jgi:ABC-type branched-subunit amino acid transport system substrate-binding protein
MRLCLAPLALAALAGCAAARPVPDAGPAAAAAAAREASCDGRDFAAATPACRGRIALVQSDAARAAGRWRESAQWAQRALDNLEPALQGAGRLALAAARYALGETAGVEAELRASLPYASGPSQASETHYYLAELAWARGDAREALNASAAALRAWPEAPWRLAVESLLFVAGTHPDVLAQPDALPAEVRGLAAFAAGEADARAGRYADALKSFREAAADPSLAALGLAAKAAGRVEEITARGAGKPGTLGFVLPLSGRLAPFGAYALRGVLLGADPWKDEGLTLLVENDRGEPYRSMRAVRALAKNGAMAVAGGLVGKSAEAAVQAANALGVPGVVLSSVDLPPLAPWAVRMAVTPAQQIEALLREGFDKRGYRRFAILYPNDAFGLNMRDVFWSAVIARGGLVTGAETYRPGVTDFKAPIKALVGADDFPADELKARKEANQPLAHLDFDAVFIPDGGATVALVLPQLLYFDVRGPVFFGPATWNDPQLIRLGRDYAEGTFFVDWFWSGDESAPAKTFASRFEDAYGAGPRPALTAQAYEAARVLAANAKLETRGLARDALVKNDWATFGGKARVAADGEVERPLTILTVTGRQIVPAE